MTTGGATAIGIGVGTAIGVATDDLVVWIAVGVGAVIGAATGRASRK